MFQITSFPTTCGRFLTRNPQKFALIVLKYYGSSFKLKITGPFQNPAKLHTLGNHRLKDTSTLNSHNEWHIVTMLRNKSTALVNKPVSGPRDNIYQQCIQTFSTCATSCCNVESNANASNSKASIVCRVSFTRPDIPHFPKLRDGEHQATPTLETKAAN